MFLKSEKNVKYVFSNTGLYTENQYRGQTDGQTDTGHSRYRAMYSRCTYVARQKQWRIATGGLYGSTNWGFHSSI